MRTRFKTILGACLLALAVMYPAMAEWKTDLDAATKEAKKDGKLLLLDFTGSDWCPPCIAMKKEALDDKAFQDYAAKNLVLVEVDFPRRKSLSAAQKKANDALQSKHHVEGYPTFLILDADGKEVGRHVGYLPGGATGFIAKIEELKKKFPKSAG